MFRMRSRWFAVVALLGAPHVAHSQPKASEPAFSASLEYVAPGHCPTSDDFRTIVIARLGFDPFVDKAPEHVLVSIAEHEPTLVGRIEWRDEKGRWAGDRTFPSRTNDCADLARAMGFALAVQINLLATGQSPDAFPDGTPATTAPAAPETQASSPRPVVVPATTADSDAGAASGASEASGVPWTFGVGAGASLAVGMAPSVLVLGRLFGTVARGPLSFELGGELSAQTVKYREDGAGYSQSVMLATAAGCGTQGLFSLCVLLKAGVLNVGGRNIDAPASPTGTLVQTGLRFGVRERFGPTVFLAQHVEGLGNVTQWTVTLDEIPVWSAPIFAGTLGLDVGVIF